MYVCHICNGECVLTVPKARKCGVTESYIERHRADSVEQSYVPCIGCAGTGCTEEVDPDEFAERTERAA